MGMAYVAIAIAAVWLFGFMGARFLRRQKQLYAPHIATVLGLTPTGRHEGDLEEQLVSLEIAGKRTRRAEVRQFFTAAHVPRPGEVVRVTQQGDALLLVGFAEGGFVAATKPLPPTPRKESHREAKARVVEAAELTPALRDDGRLAIVTILDARKEGSSATRFTLEIDAIHAPKRIVVLQQDLPQDTYAIGDRAYLLVDPENYDAMHLLPPSLTGGHRLPREMNRLDPYVLGPELLRHGARARGTVLTATPVLLAPEMEVRGFHRFRLRFHIEPEAGLPAFEAEQSITLTRPDKIRRMATPGAIVPIRFDAADPQCFTTDSLAMGYNDPYADALSLFREQLSETEAP